MENLRQFFSNFKRQSIGLIFVILGVLIFFFIVWYLISNLSFLVKSFNNAFNVDISGSSSAGDTFDLEAARRVIEEDM